MEGCTCLLRHACSNPQLGGRELESISCRTHGPVINYPCESIRAINPYDLATALVHAARREGGGGGGGGARGGWVLGAGGGGWGFSNFPPWEGGKGKILFYGKK